MAAVVGGPVTWTVGQDDEGYRTYKVFSRVKATKTESPYAVMSASGLPTIGSPFQISGFSGVDQWVWCRPELNVSIDQEKKGDPAQYYLVENVYSNKMSSGSGGKNRRCQDTPITDPLLEPMKISGSFGKAAFEARYDKDGKQLVTSMNEPLTGATTTFDYVRPTVVIEQNVLSLGLSTFAGMVNTLNASPLWGCPVRCVKLNNAPWDRKVYGRCNFFYTRKFEFEVDYYNKDKDGTIIGFDREVPDTGNWVLDGRWETRRNAAIPYGSWQLKTSTTYVTSSTLASLPMGVVKVYKDMSEESTRCLLDGHGRPANTIIYDMNGTLLTGASVAVSPYTDSSGRTGPPSTKVIRYYRESNFLQLGIPTTF